MTQTTDTTGAAPAAGITTLTTRGVSRKLLARKAAAKAASDEVIGEALEDAFPAAAQPNDPEGGGSDTLEKARAGTAEPAGAAAPEPGGHDANAADGAVAAMPSPVPDPTPLPSADAAAITPAEPESGLSDAAAAAPARQPASAPAWSEADESALNTLLARRKAAGYQRRGRDVSGQLICLGDVTPNPDTVVAVIVGLVARAGGSVSRAELLDMMAAATFPHPKARPSDRGWSQGFVAGAIRMEALAVRAAINLVKTRSEEVGSEPQADVVAATAA